MTLSWSIGCLALLDGVMQRLVLENTNDFAFLLRVVPADNSNLLPLSYFEVSCFSEFGFLLGLLSADNFDLLPVSFFVLFSFWTRGIYLLILLSHEFSFEFQ